MSQSLKPPVIIAIAAALVLLLGLIGYKVLGPSSAVERTDAAHQQTVSATSARAAQLPQALRAAAQPNAPRPTPTSAALPPAGVPGGPPLK